MINKQMAYVATFCFITGWLFGLMITPNESQINKEKAAKELPNAISKISNPSCPLLPHLVKVMTRVSSAQPHEQLNQKQRCNLIHYVNAMSSVLKDEIEDDQVMIYQHLISRRNTLITQKPTVHLSDKKPTLILGDLSSASTHQLDIFLKPTCGKCAKFYFKFLSDKEDLHQRLVEAKRRLNITIRPYQSAAGWYQNALPSSAQAQVDQELASMWFKLTSSSTTPNIDQLKRWYLIVKNHSVDLRYLKDPVIVFREIFDPNMTLSKAEILELTQALLEDVKALPEEEQDAPSAILDGLMWRHLKDFHLNPNNIITILNGRPTPSP